MRFITSLTGRARASAIALTFLAGATAAQAAPHAMCGGVDYNRMILDIIRDLPDGGGYSLGSDLELPTITAHNIGGGHWQMRVYDGHPSHCTSATYTVFAHLAARLQDAGRIELTSEQILSLVAMRSLPDGRSRSDGQGPFWIFNSNGAGVAALLKHTGTGFSFRDDKLLYARPGDFLKLFWNENVGSSESGHQVIYTGNRKLEGRDMVCFWSSQRQRKKKRNGRTEPLYFPASATGKVHNGYGQVCRPREDIKAMIFSRLTCMEHLGDGLRSMAAKAKSEDRGHRPDLFFDHYLAKIRDKPSNQATLDRMYGIETAPSAAFADVGIAPLR